MRSLLICYDPEGRRVGISIPNIDAIIDVSEEEVEGGGALVIFSSGNTLKVGNRLASLNALLKYHETGTVGEEEAVWHVEQEGAACRARTEREEQSAVRTIFGLNSTSSEASASVGTGP